MEDNKDLGGWSEVKPVTLHVINICLEVKKDIEEKIGKKCDVFIPVSFASQVVEGVNYMVKVIVGGVGKDECVHALIFQALPCYGGKSTVKDTIYPVHFKDPVVPI